jgi:hypothetical protein
LDGVVINGADADRVLYFLNTATDAELRAAGIYGRAVNIVLDQRPFASLKTFADTPYIGEKTVRAAVTGATGSP